MVRIRTNFEKLEIYQLSEELSDKVWAIVITWDWFAKGTLGKQLVKAADSVGSNIAEGSGRGSRVDYQRFLRIARGSLYETLHWLRRSYRRKLLSHGQVAELQPLVRVLTPKLNAYLGSMSAAGKFAAVTKPSRGR